MEVKSEHDKQELSSNDSSTFSCKSLKLGVCSRSRLKSLSASTKQEANSRDKLLASMSKKLRINNIQVLSRTSHRMSDPYEQVTLSCFPQLNTLSSVKQIAPSNYLEYEQLLQRGGKGQAEGVHAVRGQRVGCTEENCEVKRRWIRNILFYEKEVKNFYLLRERIAPLPAETAAQIEKDVGRTFLSKTLTKTKINLVQSETERYNLLDTLRQVLRLYAGSDPQVGYVQGMNMVAAPIVLHMKEVAASFIYFKEVMTYGKLRMFFVEDFENIKQEVREKFRRLLRFHNAELYQYLQESGVEYTMFVPYYLTLFATVVEVQFMHMVINEFMRDGILFLHRLFLVLLLLLKERIVQDREGEGLMPKLGATYIKSMDIDWPTLLHLTHFIEFP